LDIYTIAEDSFCTMRQPERELKPNIRWAELLPVC
jgi:hypothetical protein